MNINLSSLVKIEGINARKGQNYDLMYSQPKDGEKQGKFRLSDNAFEILGMANNGLNLYRSPEGHVVLSVQAEENSSFMTRRGSFEKGKGFTNKKMRQYLDMAGFKDTNKFALQPIGEEGEAKFYLVSEWDALKGSPLTAIGEDDEEGYAEDVEEVEEVEEEVDENPFA